MMGDGLEDMLFYEISSWKSVGLMKGVGKGLNFFWDS